MAKGTVKFFNETKGFGFITEDESNNEHFVHVSGLIDKIQEGDIVEFELTEGRKGMNAVDVKIIQQYLIFIFLYLKGLINDKPFFF